MSANFRFGQDRIGVAKPEELPPQEMVSHATIAEERGFESVWLTEDYCFTDAVAPCAAIGQATRKIGLGVGAVNIYTRSLPLIAMTAASLDNISNHRIILGVGSGGRTSVEQQGYRYHDASLKAMREALAILRHFLKGETVTYSGNVFKISGMRLALSPRTNLPIYLAAMGPRMLELCGELADGVLLSVCTPLAYLRVVNERLAQGAARSGRKLTDIDVAGYIIFSSSDDSNAARDSVKNILARELSGKEFDPLIALSGLDVELVTPIRKAIARGNFEEAKGKVTDDIIDAFSVTGSPHECKVKLQELREAGLKLPIIQSQGNMRFDMDVVSPRKD